MSITCNPNGTLTVSTIHKGQYVKRIYIFYSRSQAKRDFREYLKTL